MHNMAMAHESDTVARQLGNGHHPTCKNYVPYANAMRLLSDLVSGINWWAAQEDGVPDEIWEVYKEVTFILTGSILSDE